MRTQRAAEILALFRKRVRTIIPIFSVFVAASVIYAILSPNKYTSHASLLPSGSGASPTLGLISGLIQGLETASGENISSFLFPDILNSRQVVLTVIDAPFDSTAYRITGKTSLRELYNWKNDEVAFEEFCGLSSVSYSIDRGITKLGFTSKIPYISYFVVKTWIEKLEWYLQHSMQTKARREYEYLIIRRDESLKLISEAEESLKIFVKAHRNYMADPISNMQYERLNTNLQVARQIYSLIVQQIENAKIDMVKTVPSINILDSPQIPKIPSGPKRTLILFAGIIIGSFAVGIWIFFDETFKRLRSNTSEQ